jgi:3-methyladenine DNA glycosylase/8-oxoguanine DNA glycosylase
MPRAHLGDKDEFRKGFDHIRKKDPKLGKVLDKHGVIKFRPRGELSSEEIFEALVESILSQQLAGAAAESIIRKVRTIYPDGKLLAAAVSKTAPSKLRSAGVSAQKLSYLKDLSSKVAKGTIDLVALTEMEDEEVVEILDEVRGIGPWTVHMLLIFTFGRMNVLPVDDFGVRKGIQTLYAMEEMPKKAEIQKLAENWQPYSSVASLYLWRHKDKE